MAPKHVLFILLALVLVSSCSGKLVRRASRPASCPAGTYLLKKGSGYVCEKCKKGFYRSGTTTSVKDLCVQCPAGTTTQGTGATSITLCTSGSPSGGGGTPSGGGGGDLPCAAGTGRLKANASCSFCPTGTYNNGSYAVCQNCSSIAAILTTKGAGAVSSANCSCPSGTTPSSSADVCVCPKGKGWSPIFSNGQIISYSCQPCVAGTSIAPGTFNDGTFLNCQICANGSTTTVAGAASCDVCFPGSGFNTAVQSCTACPSGQYNPGNNKSCSTCPTVTTTQYSITATSQQDACTCTKGLLSPNGSACICPLGYGWSDAANPPQCVSCSGNTINDGTQLFCIPCASGSSADATKSVCTCPAGTGLTTATGASCVSCAAQGSKWNNGSFASCQTCAPVQSGGTATTGVNNANTGCTCAAGLGWVWNSDGVTGTCAACSSTTFNDGSYFTCQLCPAGTLPVSQSKASPQCTCGGTATPSQGYSFATGTCSTCPAGTYIFQSLGCQPCPPGAFCGFSTQVDVVNSPTALNGKAQGKQAGVYDPTKSYGICTAGLTTQAQIDAVTTAANSYAPKDFGVRATAYTALSTTLLGDGVLTDTAAAAVAQGVTAGANGLVDPGRWSLLGAATAASCYCVLDGTQILDVPISSLKTIAGVAFDTTKFSGGLLPQFCQECPLGTNNTINGKTLDAVPVPGKIPAVLSSKCVPCPKGYYQNVAGQGVCKPCPIGTTTSGTGTTDISNCA